ncbi:MAG: DUF2442 domain-containing protein [Kiritimatiellae bacterium]|nr:DUF2442 domain-containing protein [Kiritimatiellia bacterium]
MSALDKAGPSAVYADGIVSIKFPDGATISFPVRGNRLLEAGTDAQRSNMEVSPFGIHWPDLDEDLSFAGLARGDYGQNGHQSESARMH